VNDTKWEQYGALAGVVFVVLVLLGAFIPGSPPAPDDSAREIHEFFVGNDDGLKIAGYLNGLAIFPFLVFLGSLWSRVRGGEDETRRLATMVAGGGVVAVAVAAVGTVVTTATAVRIAQITPREARFLFQLAGTATGMIAFAAAVLVAATSVAVLRARVFPPWLGTVGIGLTVGWLVAGASITTDTSGIGIFGFLVFLAWLVWVLVISFMLYRPGQEAARPM
jgi:hypothetical protein